MAKTIDFPRTDFHLAGVLFEQLRAEKGRFERMGGSHRWLVIAPKSGSPDAKIEINAGDGDPNAMNLVLNATTVEPGKPIYPELAERGVTTPSGWILMADVGWVIGWRLPLDTGFERIADFSFRALKTLGAEPEDGMWRAQLQKRPPRPGFTNPDMK